MPTTPSGPKGHIRKRGNRYWIYVARGRDPITKRYRYAYPRQVLGHLGKLVAEMLAEGIDPGGIRRGLAAWHAKGLRPASLPSVVHEVMNSPPSPSRRQQSTDDLFSRHGARPGSRRGGGSTMNRQEAVALTRYVKACCPQQAIDEYTPNAWHDLLGDLDLAVCRQAAARVARRQPFVAPAEIRAEVRSERQQRLAICRSDTFMPHGETADNVSIPQ